MADVDVSRELPLPVERPRPTAAGPLAWLRANLFNGVFNTILTVAAVALGRDRCGLVCQQRPGLPGRWRLLGLHRPEIALHHVRHISLRAAVAAAARRRDLYRADCREL